MPGTRDTALDLLKWLALLSMVLDHLRYIGLDLDPLYIPGRMAFPWFCLAIAAHQARLPTEAPFPKRHLGWLIAFAVLSEAPYRLYVDPAETLNVLPTLALGLLIANACRQRTPMAMLVGAMALAVGAGVSADLMFGIQGVLLPAVMLMVWRRRWYWQVLPGALCLLANVWAQLLEQSLQGYWVAMAGIAACLLAPGLGMSLLRHGLSRPIPPLGRWAYGFYPLHFLALWALKALIQGPAAT
jgi:hypothetical protein